jgi:hypothetical protein
MTIPEDKDLLFSNAVSAVGELVAVALSEMPLSARKMLTQSLTHGGELTVISSILGTPRFVGVLMLGAGAEPRELFEIIAPPEPPQQDVIGH